MSFGFHPPLEYSGRQEKSAQQTAPPTKLRGNYPCGMMYVGVASLTDCLHVCAQQEWPLLA